MYDLDNEEPIPLLEFEVLNDAVVMTFHTTNGKQLQVGLTRLQFLRAFSKYIQEVSESLDNDFRSKLPAPPRN